MTTQAQATTAPVLAGVVGFFDGPSQILAATEKVRDAKYAHFDAFTPYPVHGLEAAQGLKRSPVPFVTFAAGVTGGLTGFLFQYWTSAVDWPINVGGKPFNSWPAFVPIIFELTVLFAALCTFAAMLFLNGLPNIRRRAIDPEITNNRFALLIEAPIVKARSHGHEDDEDDEDETPAPKKPSGFKEFNEREATEFLKSLGARDVRSVYAEGWF